MEEEDAKVLSVKQLTVQNKFFCALLYFASAFLVGFGQPSSVGVFGAFAAVCGFALLFYILPSQKRRFLTASCWFFIVESIQLVWLVSLEFQGYYILFVYFFLSLFLGLQFGLLALLVPSSGKMSWWQMLSIASVWTILEWLRLYFICGFSFNPVGQSLTYFLPTLQFASLFGIFGLSFWVILTNLCVLNAIRLKTSNWALASASIAAIPYLWGVASLQSGVQYRENPLRVALVQTDLLPSEKMPYSDDMERYIPPFEQWVQILGLLPENDPVDLIVMPEGAVPYPSHWAIYPLEEVAIFFERIFGEKVKSHFPPLIAPFVERRMGKRGYVLYASNLFWCQTISNLYGAELVIGMDHSDELTKKNFNSAFHFTPGGGDYFRYDKQVLLPLAEYLPWEALRPLAKKYAIEAFFTRGKGGSLFRGKLKLGPSICYEETFSNTMWAVQKMGAELFVNLTNDNYYPKTSLHAQHFFHARVRSVENGLPLLRACNAGITAIIDCFGRIERAIETGERGTLVAVHSPERRRTLFSLWGNNGIIFMSFAISTFWFLRKSFLERAITLEEKVPL